MEALFHGTLVNARRIIYTPSAFARTNLIHLQEVGELKAQKPHTSNRKNLVSYLFFIIIEGSGTLAYDNVEYHLTPGDCVFIDCGKEYSHCSSKNLWTLKWAHFYGPGGQAGISNGKTGVLLCAAGSALRYCRFAGLYSGYAYL